MINKDNLDPMEAYLCGCIIGLQSRIPENKIIALFGDPACGKSYLIRLVANLKNKNLDEIKKAMGDKEVSDEDAMSIKDLVDNFTIVQKKTTRPLRENEEQSNPEIKAGLSEEEVKACDVTYEYTGNLYGISIKEINDALLNGNVLMIVNNIDARNQLYKKYGKQLMSVYIYRIYDQKEWNEVMKEAGRRPDEINKRIHILSYSGDMYDNIGIQNLDTILNFEGRKGNTKAVLLRLKSIVDRIRGEIQR